MPITDPEQPHEASGHDAAIGHIFSSRGPLAANIDQYRMRPSQIEMAQAIARAIEEGESLVVEAGTGTGKTFAYLVPALLWGGKVIISTGTKNLQDQLVSKDLEVVRKALNVPVSIALLKGRANYVCHLHLDRAHTQGRFVSREDTVHLQRIARFARMTQTGDKAELPGVPENASVWSHVTSTRDNCPGTDCGYYAQCFVVKARQAAQQADVVVVNHHLFFADIVLRDAGLNDLLPTANTVIFDEAHQLPDTATLFFGDRVSSAQIIELCHAIRAEGLAHARDADWSVITSNVEKAARDLRLTFASDSQKIAVNQMAKTHHFFEQLPVLTGELVSMAKVLDAHAERSEMLPLYFEQTSRLVEQLQAWADEALNEGDPEYVLWVEFFGQTIQLHKTPLSVADVFTRQREEVPERSWIFTSATLAVKNDFHYFASQLGLDSARSKTWPSPFDYSRHGLLYVPESMPLPNTPAYPDAVADAILPMIEAAGGRAFVLCTSLRAVDQIAARLREAFAERDWNYPLFVQGQSSRTDLLEKFRDAGNAVLVGSQSFWEGVDVKGEALSLVVVDKLPFAPPDDPVLGARLRAMEQAGKNGFMDLQVPEAIMSLKQGSGRLIRDEMDKGVLMICDTRIVDKGYGKRIWQSLPPFSRTRKLEDALAFFDDENSKEQ